MFSKTKVKIYWHKEKKDQSSFYVLVALHIATFIQDLCTLLHGIERSNLC